MTRAVAGVALALASALLALPPWERAARAADEAVPVPVPTGPPPRSLPLLLEMQAGPAAPLGSPAASLAGRVLPRLWLGAGAGLTPERAGERGPVVGLFARAVVIDGRFWTFWFSGGAVHWDWDQGARSVYENEMVTRTPYVWEGNVRAFAGFGMHLWGSTRAVRMEGGMGYRLGSSDSCTGCVDPRAAPAEARTAPYFVMGVTQAFGRSRGELAAAPDPLAPPAAPPAAARREDPFLHAAFASPTALTQPAGAQVLSVTAFPLPVPALVLGHHDRWQTTLHVLSGYGWSAGFLSKVRFLDRGRWHLAALIGALGISRDQQAHWFVGGAGLVGSVCLDGECRSLASVYGGGGYLDEDRAEAGARRRQAATVAGGANVVVAVVRHLKLVAEGHVGVRGPFGMPLAMVGARLPARRFALEAGVLFRRDGTAGPIVTAAFRW